MADYFAVARSNYFKVKDLRAFTSEAADYGINVSLSTKRGEEGLVMIHPDNDGGWPSFLLDPETGDEYELDVAEWVGSHLESGHVAILQEVGFEKLRYVSGFGVAINSHGQKVVHHLDDIINQARALGEFITEPSH